MRAKYLIKIQRYSTQNSDDLPIKHSFDKKKFSFQVEKREII